MNEFSKYYIPFQFFDSISSSSQVRLL
ncbi:TPA: hypothetical protein ACPDSV_001136 [Pasteurella multocida]